jgi:hypothetical protein
MTKKSETFKARVLTDCPHGKCGAVAVFDAESIEAARADIHLDFDPDAVAYAEAELAARQAAAQAAAAA